jgi:sarcosine oxidase subunit alpha
MDIGHNWIVSKVKVDFIGKRSFTRPDITRKGRKQLVGILSVDPNVVLPEGAHLEEEVKPKPPMVMLGHVTSSYMSPNVGRSIAMAMIKDGQSRMGETLYAPMLDGKTHKVVVCEPIFFDKEGERARV